MTSERPPLDPRRQQALAELRGLIAAKYPTATFGVSTGSEDPQETWLTARVDLDDPDEVLEVVRDRVLEYQLDEGLPVYVLPLRTPERAAALRRELAQRRPKASAIPHIAPPSS
jgi:hypothetical protein